MHKYQVVGFRPYSGEYEGRKYSGYYLHCLAHPNRDDFEGQMVKEIKCKSKYGYVPRVGDEILVTYGEYGIESIEVM